MSIKHFFLTLLILAFANTILLHHQAHRVGGFTNETPVADQNNLDAEHKTINDFVRNNIPQVLGLTLLSYRQQVVAGTNYCLTYGNPAQPTASNKVTICVWSQPWMNHFLQAKRPNGQIVRVGGKNPIYPFNYVKPFLIPKFV